MNTQLTELLIPSLVPLVQAIAFAYLKNDQEVEDVTQDVLLKFLCAVRKGNLHSPRSWIRATSRNTAVDCLLRKRRLHEDECATARLNSLRDHEALQIPAQSQVSDFDSELHTLWQLPESQRSALFLSACGYSYKEIAAKQNVSIGTVRSRIHYARIKSQSLLSASA